MLKFEQNHMFVIYMFSKCLLDKMDELKKIKKTNIQNKYFSNTKVPFYLKNNFNAADFSVKDLDKNNIKSNNFMRLKILLSIHYFY